MPLARIDFQGIIVPKFHVSRSIDIAAPSQKVFDVVSDFSTWTTWSPWLIAEPDAKVTVSDDPKSVGSTYAWDGQVTGAGGMEHQQLTAPNRIESEIRFLRPMKSVSQVSFDIEPSGSGCRLHWNMDGSLPWFLFWMTGSMDTWIGMDYDRGLKMVKELIESGTISSKVNIHGVQPIEAIHMVGVRATCHMSEIGGAMEKAFHDGFSALSKAGITPHEHPLSAYHSFNMKTQVTDFTAGFQIPLEAETPPELSSLSLPACSAFRVEHIGAYEHVANGWSVAQQHTRYKKLKQRKKSACFEIYRNSPEDTDPADLVTDIYMPLR